MVIMPLLDVFDVGKNRVGTVELKDEIFAAPVNETLIYEVVRMQRAIVRKGTASTKERGDVRGGGKKPWRQKGTGRARVGTIRSPLWRGGGTVFGPHPRDFSLRVNKKARRNALISALSLKASSEKIIVLRDVPLTEIKTKEFQKVVDVFSLRKALFVTDKKNEILEKSSHNIPNVKMLRAEGINVYDLLKYEYLVLLEPSIEVIERNLLG